MALLQQILGSGLLQRVLREGRDVLAECLEIAEFASGFRLAPEVAQSAITEYLQTRTPASFQRAMRRTMQKSLELPDEFVDLGLDVDDLLNFAAQAQTFGDENFNIYRDKDSLAALRKSGIAGAELMLMAPLLEKFFGIPAAIAKHQPLRKSLSGAEFAQKLGFDEALTDPEFWRDMDNPSKALTTKWMSRAEEHSQHERTLADQRLQQAMLSFSHAVAEREKERKQQETESARRSSRRIRKVRKLGKKRKPHPRRHPRPLPRGSPVTTGPKDEAYVDRQVATSAGTNFILREFFNGESALYRIDEDGPHEVLPRGPWGWAENVHQPTGLPLVNPFIGSRTGQRPASPLDDRGTGRGPVGMNP